MADNGMELRVEPYCAFCPYFESDVEKMDVTVAMDKIPRVLTTIRCKHRGLCEQVNKRIVEVGNG